MGFYFQSSYRQKERKPSIVMNATAEGSKEYCWHDDLDGPLTLAVVAHMIIPMFTKMLIIAIYKTFLWEKDVEKIVLISYCFGPLANKKWWSEKSNIVL